MHRDDRPVVSITVDQSSYSLTGFFNWIVNKGSDYYHGTINLIYLLTKYNGKNDRDAFHKMLQDEYNNLPADEVKVIEMPILSPCSSRIVQRVIGFGNPEILNKLREIPRSETSNPHTRHGKPKINGGAPLGSVLEAIGMGILSRGHEEHAPFLSAMVKILNIQRIDEKRYEDDAFKSRFVNATQLLTQNLIVEAEKALQTNAEISFDFRLLALAIFMKAFYPKMKWDDEWLKGLSQAIEDISDFAFTRIMNPYENVEELREYANEQLEPYLDLIMQQDQSSYLGVDYASQTSTEIQREIIIALLFAGGDNIKKYLDHVFVEFGRQEIRDKYLNEALDEDRLLLLLKEVGRMYVTIYAQSGKSESDFTIHYQKNGRQQDIHVKNGDELHYTTWQANRDELEWGIHANEFNPDANQEHYSALNPLATFGSGNRMCYGRMITTAIILHVAKEFLDKFRWEAKVDGHINCHPCERGFNQGVQGVITYSFTPVQAEQLSNSPGKGKDKSYQCSSLLFSGYSGPGSVAVPTEQTSRHRYGVQSLG